MYAYEPILEAAGPTMLMVWLQPGTAPPFTISRLDVGELSASP